VCAIGNAGSRGVNSSECGLFWRVPNASEAYVKDRVVVVAQLTVEASYWGFVTMGMVSDHPTPCTRPDCG
jgi:hypothetical protein